MDWTSGLDYWTGLLDYWTDHLRMRVVMACGLTLKVQLRCIQYGSTCIAS